MNLYSAETFINWSWTETRNWRETCALVHSKIPSFTFETSILAIDCYSVYRIWNVADCLLFTLFYMEFDNWLL